MTSLNLLYTELEDDLRASVAGLLKSRCTPSKVLAACDGDSSLSADLWSSLTRELGLAGLLIAESNGGAGASAREAAVVLEELGRFVAPVPYLSSAVLASVVLGSAAPQLSASIADGSKTAALVVPLTASPHDAVPAALIDDAGQLTGNVRSVAGVQESDVLLVPARTDEGTALYAVSTADAHISAVSSLDQTRPLADVELKGVPGELLISEADTALNQALLFGAGLLASEQVGVAQWCLDATVDYLKERRQFGRVIGSYQAIKHRLADVYTIVESARAAARYAAAALSDSEDVPTAVAVAQAYCSNAAVTAAEEAVQLHAGLGMTWEHPAHLYLKRAKATQLAFGTPGAHRAALSTFIDLPAT